MADGGEEEGGGGCDKRRGKGRGRGAGGGDGAGRRRVSRGGDREGGDRQNGDDGESLRSESGHVFCEKVPEGERSVAVVVENSNGCVRWIFGGGGGERCGAGGIYSPERGRRLPGLGPSGPGGDSWP